MRHRAMRRRIGLVCGLDFYGVDHVLYASDAPFGPEGGAHYIRSQMAAVASLDIPPADKEKICSGKRGFVLRNLTF